MKARAAAMLLGATLVASACAGSITGAPVEPSPGPSVAHPSSLPSDASPLSPTPSPRRPDPSGLRVSTAGWRTDFTRATVDLSEILSGGPPKDGIPAVDSPVFESIAQARTWLSDVSPVISLEVNGAARAYPLAILLWHEIANDELGGTPVVVTFCPLCNTALVFERNVGGATYDFGVSGNLRFSDMVMFDRQTESWWQQATGESIVGEHAGTRLTFVPSQVVSLADFERAHPGGDVLSRETGHQRSYGINPYVGYDAVDQNPFLFTGVVDGRLAPMERVVTVGEAAEAVAFPYSELRQTGVATGVLDGLPLAVFWAPGTASALDANSIDLSRDIGATGVFLATAKGQTLNFARQGGEDGPIVDAETGSTWAITGVATAGPLEGTQLDPVVHGDHFWLAWAAFVPETTIWAAP